MLDRFNRKIDYLRISVTDRCNLRCTYCMPAEGVTLFDKKEILNFAEITEVVRVAVKYGIKKIRITGGEPLVRLDIVKLAGMIKSVSGITELSLTTNGTLLDKFAQPLAEAGLDRVNISLDTMNPDKYRTITRGGDIKDVFRGIEAAKNANLFPVKINCVIKKSSDEPDAKEVAEFCKQNGLICRFIKMMNMRSGEFSVVLGGSGGDCGSCNRLRLTSNGYIKPCLFGEEAFSIREMGIENAILRAVGNKPEFGTANKKDQFYNVGG